jgi:hypothetical protein
MINVIYCETYGGCMTVLSNQDWGNLPKPVIERICYFLPCTNLIKMRLVCYLWNCELEDIANNCKKVFLVIKKIRNAIKFDHWMSLAADFKEIKVIYHPKVRKRFVLACMIKINSFDVASQENKNHPLFFISMIKTIQLLQQLYDINEKYPATMKNSFSLDNVDIAMVILNQLYAMFSRFISLIKKKAFNDLSPHTFQENNTINFSTELELLFDKWKQLPLGENLLQNFYNAVKVIKLICRDSGLRLSNFMVFYDSSFREIVVHIKFHQESSLFLFSSCIDLIIKKNLDLLDSSQREQFFKNEKRISSFFYTPLERGGLLV